MAEEIVYKKFNRKADQHLNGTVEAKHGKQINQKIKPYVVLQFLLKFSDENNVCSAFDIIAFLEDCGLSAERRSIYRDIEEINKVSLMLENECSIDEAEEMLLDDEDDELKLVVYDKNKKGTLIWTTFACWLSASILQRSLQRDRQKGLLMLFAILSARLRQKRSDTTLSLQTE